MLTPLLMVGVVIIVVSGDLGFGVLFGGLGCDTLFMYYVLCVYDLFFIDG